MTANSARWIAFRGALLPGLVGALWLTTLLAMPGSAARASDGDIGVFAHAAGSTVTASVPCGRSMVLWVYALFDGETSTEDVRYRPCIREQTGLLACIPDHERRT